MPEAVGQSNQRSLCHFVGTTKLLSRKASLEEMELILLLDGHEDSLKKKNHPKLNGVYTLHPDISILKLKTIGAEKYFSDELVLSSGFVDEATKIIKFEAKIKRRFMVKCLFKDDTHSK
ncbi:hypothetical protein O181_132247 [Austropuccinia psidii MF-1]|uniref:Uncharacterized protein n=1 Tax=Austropuccinia psidii MF-1 TaxID=1389203 RepID=A0A9Q3L705_9BASI|nr:hypothetical protein [Austropuccinia psidii MF-1]